MKKTYSNPEVIYVSVHNDDILTESYGEMIVEANPDWFVNSVEG